MKKKFTWRAWWIDWLKTIPLYCAILLAFNQSFAFGIVSGILGAYVGHLYDLEWQRKTKF